MSFMACGGNNRQNKGRSHNACWFVVVGTTETAKGRMVGASCTSTKAHKPSLA
jgi:hypothetical protein